MSLNQESAQWFVDNNKDGILAICHYCSHHKQKGNVMVCELNMYQLKGERLKRGVMFTRYANGLVYKDSYLYECPEFE